MGTLVSIQVGKVQTHQLPDGEEWTSAYVKTPVDGPVYVGKLNVAGDEQRNTKVHGGEHRAILAYSADHYAKWRMELRPNLAPGAFGENFDITGLNENIVCIGDVYTIGDTVRVQVSQPRQPCNNIYKHLGVRGIQNRVGQTRRTGWYMRVLQEGEVEAGMPVGLLERPYPMWSIAVAHGVMDNRLKEPHQAAQLAKCEALEPGWRKKLAQAANIELDL